MITRKIIKGMIIGREEERRMMRLMNFRRQVKALSCSKQKSGNPNDIFILKFKFKINKF